MQTGVFELRDQPATSSTQIAIVNGVFDTNRSENLEAYLRYYNRQCKQVTSIAMMGGAGFPLRTNSDLLDIIADIRDSKPYSDIVADLTRKWGVNSNAQMMQNAIDLAVRLLTMIDVGTFNNVYTGREAISWSSGTLAEFLKTQGLFDARPAIPCDGIKLETDFHACNIERIAGISVHLTTNLSDHLLLREDTRESVVYVFHHAAFLHSHSESSAIFPPGFIEETLHTLGILFPKGSKKVEKWYRGKGKQEDLDFTVLRFRHPRRRIDEYEYWRDRLVVLKEAFDDSGPRTLTQWWHDRRDATQWYALWIAVFFTVFFGLIQSVVGILQLYRP